jgi:hypothetical protein
MALGIVGGSAGVALANVVYDAETLKSYPDGKCLDARAEVSHGSSDHGYRRVDVYTQKEGAGGFVNCAVGWERPIGWLKARSIYWKYYKNAEEWAVCRNTGWAANGQATDAIRQEKSYADEPCGNGWYDTMAGGSHFFDGSWVGGFVHSGYHYFAS